MADSICIVAMLVKAVKVVLSGMRNVVVGVRLCGIYRVGRRQIGLLCDVWTSKYGGLVNEQGVCVCAVGELLLPGFIVEM